MAAVLAAGPGAALSDQSAAALWELRLNSRGRDRRHGARREAVDARASGCTALAPRRRDHHPSRHPGHHSLARDLRPGAASCPGTAPSGAISELERLHLPDPVSLQELLTRHPQRRGSKSIREILADFEPDPDPRGVRALLSRRSSPTNDLPRPTFNEPLVLAGGRQITPDCLWRSQRLIVELDGRDAHARRLAFEADRARDRALTVAGYRVIRITWRQLRDEPLAVAADLRSCSPEPSDRRLRSGASGSALRDRPLRLRRRRGRSRRELGVSHPVAQVLVRRGHDTPEPRPARASRPPTSTTPRRFDGDRAAPSR